MKTDPHAKRLEPIGERGKRAESSRVQLHKYNQIRGDSFNKGKERNVCWEDAIMGLLPTTERRSIPISGKRVGFIEQQMHT